MTSQKYYSMGKMTTKYHVDSNKHVQDLKQNGLLNSASPHGQTKISLSWNLSPETQKLGICLKLHLSHTQFSSNSILHKEVAKPEFADSRHVMKLSTRIVGFFPPKVISTNLLYPSLCPLVAGSPWVPKYMYDPGKGKKQSHQKCVHLEFNKRG